MKNPESELDTLKIRHASLSLSLSAEDGPIGPQPVEGSRPEPYQVDLDNLSCTCPDFTDFRSQFPDGDARRLCKHQRNLIAKLEDMLSIDSDPMLKEIILKDPGHGFPAVDSFFKLAFDPPIKGPESFYLMRKKDHEWVDVFLFEDGGCERSGYSLKDKRWAYSDNPFPHGSKTIHNLAIQKAFEGGTVKKKKAKDDEDEPDTPEPKGATKEGCLGCLLIVVIVVGVIWGISSFFGDPKPEKEWFAGGTLHQEQITDWKKASPENKLATAADLVCTSPKIKKLIQDAKDINVAREYAEELIICIDGAHKNITTTDHQKVSESAAICMTMMGWL